MHTVDDVSRVGEGVVQHGSIDYCAPEALEEGAVASHAIDMFSLGRIVMWLTTADEGMWPDLPHGCTDADKHAFLMSDKEFTLNSIQHAATRDIVKRLVTKHPEERQILTTLKALYTVHMSHECRTPSTCT
jgi:serine/threonine protein kinase